MEVDHVAYIFGSFSRRRQCEDATAPKRRSLDKTSLGMTSTTSLTRCSGAPRGDLDERFLCPLCQRQFVEPRVLPCLHAFCTGCLMELESVGHSDSWSGDIPPDAEIAAVLPFGDHGVVDVGLGQPAAAPGGGSTGSGGSGCESAPRSGSDGSWTPDKRRGARRLACPTCGVDAELPPGGVAALIPHYVLQNRIVLASLNRDTTRLLCDLCSTDVSATSRCTDCLLSLCRFCADAHARQRITSGHEVLPLSEARTRGIARVRRAAMCPAHPDQELRLFCAACRAVACRECCLRAHRGHACETVQRAALAYTCSVRDALQKAKPMAELATFGLSRVQSLYDKVETRCAQVQVEVDEFVDSYAAAVEQHRRTLQRQVLEARDAKLRLLRTHEEQLRRRAGEATTAVRFAEDLLAEGSDVEILSFVTPLTKRLDACIADGRSTTDAEARVSESVEFLPCESAGRVNTHLLFGVVTTQSVSLQHTSLNTEGLLNCRQHKKAEAVLVTKDADEQPLCHGGEKVSAELRYRDASQRRIPIQVTDLRNGTYVLTFVPDSPGSLNLSVNIQGKPILGSPYRVCVRTLRPHHGAFHCCSFCSSGGSKEASCGCGGTMPGGYQGCGHGHEGHPGRRHWSCCGNPLENSECAGRTTSAVYQFTF